MSNEYRLVSDVIVTTNSSVGIFLVGLRWPASKAMPVSYIVAVVLALFVWKVPGVELPLLL